jgi:hypothetical protein
MAVYGKSCIDNPPPTDGCGGKDVITDGVYNNKIDYVDLNSFIKRYSGYYGNSTTVLNCFLPVTPTVTTTVTPTPVVTFTGTPTVGPTITLTNTPTVTPTVTYTVTPTVTPTVTHSITPTVTPTPFILYPLGIICGPLDVNGDNKLDYVDYYDYLRAHLHYCNDIVQYTGCGPKDLNNDRYLDYIDSYNFIKYYDKPSCLP